MEPREFVDENFMKTHLNLHQLYNDVLPLIWDYVCYNINPRVLLDKNVLTKCLKLQDALIKAGIPSMDISFDGVQKIIHDSMMLKAVKFNFDGTGQPYLFASDKDVAADLKEKKSSTSWLIFNVNNLFNGALSLFNFGAGISEQLITRV